MHNIIRPTVYLNDLAWFNPKSLLVHLENPDEPLIDVENTITSFRKYSREIYTPILQFFLENRIEVNLIVTAHFLEQSKKFAKANLTLIKQLIAQKLAFITAECYNGEGLSSIYNIEWWASQMIQSIESISNILKLKPEFVFVNQIYRGLEIERIVFETGINQFIIRQKGSKLLPFKLRLSELRRFGGESVSWINDQNDQVCDFIALPDAQFYEPNQLIFLPNRDEQVKKFGMEIGLQSSLRKLKKPSSKPNRAKNLRLSEYPSLGLYNDLERSVIRLWEYSSTLILSRYNFQRDYPQMREIFKTFSKIQNKDYLFYLNKRSYYEGAQLNFTSPYEAFATMQTIVKVMELSLKQTDINSIVNLRALSTN